MSNNAEDNYLKKELYELIKTDESIFDFIQESSLDGLWYWDLENPENEWMNPKFWTVLGYNPEEMPHKSIAWQNIINQDDLKVAIDNFTKHCENANYPYDQIVRYTHKNGSIIWIRCRGLAIRDVYGKPLRMLGAHQDISNFKNNEHEIIKSKEKAEESEEKYRAMYNNAPLSYQSLDENGCFIDINPMWLKTLGYERSEVIGKWYGDFLHPDYVEHFRKNFPAFKKRGYVSDVQFKLRRKDNSYIYVSFEGCIGYTPEGKFKQTNCVFKDITEQKALEQHFIKAKEKAEESNRLKTAFLQNMSHEIRTPMNAIMGFSSLLAKNFNNKEKLENFSNIIDQRCNDLLNIINDVLDISKIESGHAAICLEPCNINELFDEINLFFNDYKRRLNKLHINLCFQALESSFINIKTDKIKLKQVLINLITNSLKYTETGSISCICKYEHDKLLFQISDTGIGIPADKFDYIFERFSQINHPTIQNVGGTGLGLPIVKGLVKLLGGSVWLESECNKGTTFYFTIDYISVDKMPNTALHSEPKQEFNTNKTILIVEDDFYNAEYLKEVLSNVSSNILTAYNGLSAVKIVHEQKIDLILMDIRLPDISGYEATQLILRVNPKIKIIAQTAYAANTEHQKAIEAGCVDYISKPTKQEELIIMLKKYLK